MAIARVTRIFRKTMIDSGLSNSVCIPFTVSADLFDGIREFDYELPDFGKSMNIPNYPFKDAKKLARDRNCNYLCFQIGV